jgi:putative redox protein
VLDYFRSLGIIRDENFPDFPEEWLGNFERVSPVKYIAEIAPRPLLLVHGSQDDMVSVSHAYKLYAEAGEPKNIVIFSNAGHRLRRDNRAVAIVIDWLKSQGGVGA